MNKKIKISKGLEELLEKIKSSSTVAKLILETTIEGHSLPVIENGVDYLSVSESDTNKISYLSCDRINTISENDYWISGKRYHISPAKIVAKLFDKSILNFINSKDIEIFSNVYRSCQVDNKVKFHIVKGDEIKTYYNHKQYSRNINGELCGSLGASCMRYDRCEDYFSIYTENKEVSLLCLLDKNTDTLIGRAILWNIEAQDVNLEVKHYKIMDRIYTINDDFYTNLFENWAKNNDYYHKAEQTFSNCTWFIKGDKKINLCLRININTHYKYFPYLDTFKFLDLDKSTVYNYPIEGVPNLKIMNSTEGYLNRGTDYCFDEITRIVHHRNDTIPLTYLNDIRVFHGTVHHSYVHDCYILKDHAEYNCLIDDYIFNAEYDRFNNKEKIEERKKEKEEKERKREMLKSSSNQDILEDLLTESFAQLINPSRIIRPVEPTEMNNEDSTEDLTEDSMVEEDMETLREDMETLRRSQSSSRRRPPTRRQVTFTPPGVYLRELNGTSVRETDINENINTEETVGSEEPTMDNIDPSSAMVDWISNFYTSSTIFNGRIYSDFTTILQPDSQISRENDEEN